MEKNIQGLRERLPLPEEPHVVYAFSTYIDDMNWIEIVRRNNDYGTIVMMRISVELAESVRDNEDVAERLCDHIRMTLRMGENELIGSLSRG